MKTIYYIPFILSCLCFSKIGNAQCNFGEALINYELYDSCEITNDSSSSIQTLIRLKSGIVASCSVNGQNLTSYNHQINCFDYGSFSNCDLLFFPDSNGTYYFKFKLTDTINSCDTSFYDTIYRNCGLGTASISKIDIKEELKLSPNPATNSVHIEFVGNRDGVKWEIWSLTGVLVLKGELPENSEINVSNLPSGQLYVLRLTGGEGLYSVKKFQIIR